MYGPQCQPFRFKVFLILVAGIVTTMLLAAALLMLMSKSSELKNFVESSDSAFRWSEKSPHEAVLVSQSWKGGAWRHTLHETIPADIGTRSTAILIITGDRVDSADLPYAESLASESKLPVYTLFDIPNQPIEGRREDDLIAHTFEKYFESEDTSWPLLFPMTKSVIRALDAIEEWSAQSGRPIKKFILTGASKRGWTTWLAGAVGDRRIIGLAPQVFDNLSFVAQLKHQLELWGHYSEMIGDYTSRGLEQVSSSDAGKRLIALMDPAAYLKSIIVPTLVVKGSNDRFWATDATSIYWSEMKMAKGLCVVANGQHSTRAGEVPTLAAFAATIAKGKSMPSLEVLWSKTSVILSGMKRAKCRLWAAESDSLDFRDKVFKIVAEGVSGTPMHLPSGAKHLAVYPEMQWGENGWLASPIKVLTHPSRR